MKKYLILLLSIFSIFIISDRVEALSYIASDNKEYQVTDVESFRDYCYFKFIKGTDNTNLIIQRYYTNVNVNYSFCIYYNNSNVDVFNYNSTTLASYNKSGRSIYTSPAVYNALFNVSSYSYNFSKTNYENSTGTNIRNDNIFYSSYNILNVSDNSIFYASNFTFEQIENKYLGKLKYTITYYLNNEVYNTFEVEEGSSHILIDDPIYDSSTQYWSNWSYDENIDLSNITSNINIYGTVSDKPIYTVTYYINNEKYKDISVIEGNSISLEDYTDYNKYTHSFSGWSYDENIDLSNITQDVDIRATLTEITKTPVYIDFPITKEEFYVLLVMLGTLIMMLFLKWCFPFKMGGDLK